MLKQVIGKAIMNDTAQPPSGGCVLKPGVGTGFVFGAAQPPSGGCVLKHWLIVKPSNIRQPAAFRRLCVETTTHSIN